MDNKKNVRFSGMGIYMIIVIIAAMFIMYVARMNTGTSNSHHQDEQLL
jgi:cell division protease FtsH